MKESNLEELADDERQAVEVSNLVVTYKNFVAVNGISFQVRKGEILGLLGPNGAGKTSILKVLSTLKRAKSGTVKVLGFDVARFANKIRPEIGVVCQQSALDNNLDVFDNLYFYTWLQGMPSQERKERIIQILDFFGLGEKRTAKVYSLSGGEYRRLQLARVFLADASVYLLDEPTLGLDVQAKSILWESLKRGCKKNGYAVVLATNDLVEAERICDQICLIEKGRLVASESLERLQKLIDKTMLEVEFEFPVRRDIPCVVASGLNGVLVKDNRIEIEWPKNGEVFSELIRELEHYGRIKSMALKTPSLSDVILTLLKANSGDVTHA